MKSASFKQSPLKITGIVIMVIMLVGITWWLVSPLFLEGPMSNEMIDVNDPSTTVLASGNLVMIDNNHWGEGLVRLVMNPEGGLAIQFIEVNIANGPGLVLYLSDKSAFTGLRDTPGNYVDLGELEATSGSFSVPVDQNLDFDINSVLVWCDPFSVVFTYATMEYL